MGGVRRRPRLLVLLTAVAVLTGSTAAACGDEAEPIPLGDATRTDVAEVVDAPARVTARSAATLTAPAEGTLAALRVRPGDTVRVGQVVAVVDSPATRDRLRQAERALSAARATRPSAGRGGSDLRRIQRDTDRAAAKAFGTARQTADQIADPRVRAALLAQVQAAETQYRVATEAAGASLRSVERGIAGLNSAVGSLSAAQRLQAQQAYDLAKAAVDALTLRAPIAGVVQYGGGATEGSGTDLSGLLGAAGSGPGGAGALPGLPGPVSGPLPGVDAAVPVGGVVSVGTPVLTIVDVSELGLVAEIDETDVLLVKPGVPATAEFDAVTGASYPARVSSVDVLPTNSAGGGVAYRARLTLSAGTAEGGAAPTPRPGMNAVVHLRVREAGQAVAVPAAAVFAADGGSAVWAVRDGRAERVAVTVGVQGTDLVQIVDGLAPGQRIVVGGTDRVRSGQQLG
ncbi:efflux RND transporter periplasmic adaptor subunit [Plantactinospora sp. GCM10030261]|uniref:efflux RND transporter periplasmic adaptor subunit n=1 Tax=Plantactinospora sp. GCM10030261 TaxID=3273420 RepID=UPI00360750E6